MSQAKVDRYKQEKANRKEIMKKKQRQSFMRKAVACIIAVAIIGWVGFSMYSSHQAKQPAEEVTVDYSAVSDFQDSAE